LIFFRHLFRKGTFEDDWSGFLKAGCPCYHPANSAEAKVDAVDGKIENGSRSVTLLCGDNCVERMKH